MALEIHDYYGNTILIHVVADFETAGLNGHYMRKVMLVCKRPQRGMLGPARSASVTKWRVKVTAFEYFDLLSIFIRVLFSMKWGYSSFSGI